ncbi:DedA family protein [Sphingobium lactosutens]|nr:DedA family protein [Sphingobium lactosutens]
MLMLLGMTIPDRATLGLAVLVTAAGSLCGSLGWYAIGRSLGERRVEAVISRFGHYIFFKLKTYRLLAMSYRRNQFKVTLFGQTVPVARVYLGLPAGVLKLPPYAFMSAAGIGILIWNIPFLALGFSLKGSAQAPSNIGLRASAILIGAEIIIVVVARYVTRRRVRLRTH